MHPRKLGATRSTPHDSSLRTLLKQPSFTIAAVLTLALGIGANASIFSCRVAVIPLSDWYAEPVRPMLFLLFALAGVVQLVACGNVANLVLARLFHLLLNGSA